MRGKNKFRNSTFKELIDRNIGNPAKLKKIKKKIQMAFAILASGLGYSNAEIFCDFNDFPILKESSFYDYLHLMEPILEKIADQVCKDKLLEAQLKEQFVVGLKI